jgi:predicted Zn-dependent protease
MWPFDSSPTEKQQKRLVSFEERISDLERRMKAIELEWELAYEKLHTYLGRIAKRAEKLHNEAESAQRLAPLDEEETSVEELSAQNGGISPTWARLTAKQKHIQQQILSRRARMSGGG